MVARAAEVTPESLDAAIKHGVDYLLARQNKNGSWGSAEISNHKSVHAPVPGAFHAFRAGATGLAFSGLIDAGDGRPEAAAAIARAATWTATELPNLRRADPSTMYNVWGHAYGLRSISRLYQREADPAKKAEWARLGQQQVDFVNRYEDINGGWGYYDIFDGLATQKPSGMPTSFTTATMLLALDHSRRVMGLTLNEKFITRAVRSINAQRAPDFAYAYAYPLRMKPRLDVNRPAGSLSRSQSCNAALRVFGEKEITDEALTTCLDRFLAREGFLGNIRKRPIPHEGAFQIAGYFYYYGIYYFTESVRLLPPEKHAAYAEKLAAIVLSQQEKDGSWWDFPLYDYHQAYGTGYALMTLTWCREAMKK
jgi:hypothetical protein